MKKQNSKPLVYGLLVGVTLSVGCLLPITMSRGEVPVAPSAAVATDCRLSPNPEECYFKQGQPQWSRYELSGVMPTAFNAQSLGLEGPFSAELRYDADLAWILGISYMQAVVDRVGIAIKLTAGAKELRANLTTGYALSPDQQLKLTYEYLTQNLPFDFASGTVNQWVDQQAIGVAYQYAIRHQLLDSLELNGYIIRAGSKDLSDLSFNPQPLADNAGYLYDVDYRRIAGGSENTLLGSVNLLPFATQDTRLTLGIGYSSVNYNMVYESGDHNAKQKLAYKAQLTRILSPITKFNAGINATAATTEHQAGLAHIFSHKLEAWVKAQYNVGQAGMKNNSALMVGVVYPAPYSYTNTGFSAVQEFKAWLEKPIIYSARVLAVKDEKVERHAFTTGATIPDQTLAFTQLLTEVLTNSYFNWDDPGAQLKFSVLTQKIAANGLATRVMGGVASDDKDYTSDLNLQLAITGPNQAVLKSASSAGVPATNGAGQSNAGSYRITLTAVATTNGLNPMRLSSGFNLLINAGGGEAPQWDATELPAANMGFSYPQQGEMEVNVSAKVTPMSPDTSVAITIEDEPRCIHPAWLVLSACVSNTKQMCLSSAQVPNSSDDPSFCVRLKATGNSSAVSSVQPFTSAIIQAPPTWGDITPINLDVADVVSKTYLNGYVENSLGLVIAPAPGFDDTHWLLGNDEVGYYLQQKSAPSALPIGSVLVPVKASNSTSTISASQSIPFYISNAALPAWANTTGKTIQFDTTGDGEELGTVNDGILLNAMIANSAAFSGLTFIWDSTDTTPHDNWQIKNSGDNYYLLRVRDTSGTPATVDATDVGNTVSVPSIKACDIANPMMCVSSGQAGSGASTTIQAVVNPDQNLVYQYVDSVADAVALVGATSDGNGSMNPSLGSTQSPVSLSPTAPVGVFTSVHTIGLGATQVVNDSAAIYIKRQGASSQGYLTYNEESLVTSIHFLAPTASEYAALIANPNSGYLNAASKANGNGANLPAQGNVLNLPPLTASELILVPDITGNNKGYVTNNAGKNIGVGVSPVGGVCTPSAHHAVTALVFTLTAVPGKTYAVKQLTVSGGSNKEAGICAGIFLPISDAHSTCTGGPLTYSAENILPQDGSKHRCSGSDKYTPIPLSFTAPISFSNVGEGGNFTLYVAAQGLNDSSQMPTTYMPDMTSAPPANQRAPMIGSSFSSSPPYADFPRVILQ